jgi:hypothetical protein
MVSGRPSMAAPGHAKLGTFCLSRTSATVSRKRSSARTAPPGADAAGMKAAMRRQPTGLISTSSERHHQQPDLGWRRLSTRPRRKFSIDSRPLRDLMF